MSNDVQVYKVKVFSDGSKSWWQNGKLHRTDGPAREWADGSKVWYRNGRLHRLDGPAAEWANGSKAWYKGGKRHRIDGPAVELGDGSKEWWIEGEEFTEAEFLERTRPRAPCTNQVVEIDGVKYRLTPA